MGGAPMFYSYAYPSPNGFDAAKVEPAAAHWDKSLGEFVLDYDVVRLAADPEATLLSFLTSTYAAAADLAHWNRTIWNAHSAVRACRGRWIDDFPVAGPQRPSVGWRCACAAP